MSDKLNDFWQKDLKEIKENPARFAALIFCFVVAAILLLTDENSAGEEINLAENPAPVETPAPAENLPADKKVVAIKNAATANADKNIAVVLGANSDELYIFDPFKSPPKENVQPPPPEIPPVIIQPPPAAQVPAAPNFKFILRGTVIVGDKKSALIQKIIPNEKNSGDENLIFEIGDSLNGKKILDINQESVTFEGGEILYLDILTP